MSLLLGSVLRYRSNLEKKYGKICKAYYNLQRAANAGFVLANQTYNCSIIKLSNKLVVIAQLSEKQFYIRKTQVT